MATTKQTAVKKATPKTAAKKTVKKEVKKQEVSLSIPVFSQDGKKGSDVSLSDKLFGVAWNPDMVHEVVVAMQSNARANTAHTKDRSEVSGGGKKPWQQKGTGRARHGSRRSPIWVGGGVTFGPRNERDYSKKLNKKVRAKALASTLSKKLADGEVLLVDNFSFTAPKTADAIKSLSAIAKGADKKDLVNKSKNSALVVLSERNEAAEKSFRNLGNMLVSQAKDINPVDLLTYKYVILADHKATLETLEKRVA